LFLIVIIDIFSICLDDFRFIDTKFLDIGLGIICRGRGFSRHRRSGRFSFISGICRCDSSSSFTIIISSIAFEEISITIQDLIDILAGRELLELDTLRYICIIRIDKLVIDSLSKNRRKNKTQNTK